MLTYDNNNTQILQRQKLIQQAKTTICKCIPIETQDEDSYMTTYSDFFIQISFSEIHPLIMLYFVRRISKIQLGMLERVNKMNFAAVLGTHCVNDNADCYTFRAVIWLDTDLSAKRFLEIFNRCVEEAINGFLELNV